MLYQWAKLFNKVIKANFNRLDRPFKLTYVVTKECHSKCLNCDIWKVKPKNELTLDEVRSLAKNSPFLSWIDFTGGEPTDRKDFVELVGTFLENVPDLLLVHFPTNGLKPKRIIPAAQEILKMKVPRLVVSVSIDGPQEVNDRLRGIPGDFERACETYMGLRALKKVHTYIGMTLYQENVSLVKETVANISRLVPSFSFRDLHVNIPHVSEHYYGNLAAKPEVTKEMVLVIDELMKLRGIPRQPFEWVERMYHRRVRSYIESRKTPENCASLMASCYLSENGTVYPCNIWNEPLGNIRDFGYSLLPILESQKAKMLRKELLNKNCPNCWTPCEAYQTLAANILKLSSPHGH